MRDGGRLRRIEREPQMAMAAGPAMDFAGAAPEPHPRPHRLRRARPVRRRVRTDADGIARVPVKLPDNLTRYRVMVVAVTGPRSFGSAEATLMARLPLMVRPSAPRFLNFGDRFELPVVVQNQTDAALTVDVAVLAGNAGSDRRRRPPPRGGRERSRGGAVSDGRRARRDGRGSRSAPPPARSPTPRRWSSRSGRRPRPRPSPPTGRSTDGPSPSP